MTWLSFFSEIVKALAWPVAALVMSLIFRKELRALLSRIKRGKVGSAEFEFEQEVRALEESVTSELGTQQFIPKESSTLLDLANIDPGSAILKAWSTVEKSVIRLAEVRGKAMAVPRFNLTSVIRDLEKSEVVPAELASLFHNLRALRNRAAHDPDFAPSKESVINYLELSALLASNLDLLAKAP